MFVEVAASVSEDPRKQFGAYIRNARQEKDMSIRQLAGIIGMSPSYLRDIELGNRQAPKKQLTALALALEIPEEDLYRFYDLAGASRGYEYSDLNPYLSQNEPARAALRLARDHNLDSDAWMRILAEITRRIDDESSPQDDVG